MAAGKGTVHMDIALKPTLVIMAAGIGSRFGEGIKQLQPVGKHGEIIMDYSVHDAIEAGFGKVIFIIRKEIENDFREMIGSRIESLCAKAGVECVYTFQDMKALPTGINLSEEVLVKRKKPWGTGHAVLSCKGLIHEPFVVINADDYYGKDGFVQLCRFLKENGSQNSNHFAMAGFALKNTLSNNGSVSRGICSVDPNGYLTDIVETAGIEKTAGDIAANGEILNPETTVSMNMWGLTPAFINQLEDGFKTFLQQDPDKLLKAEYMLPSYIDYLLKQKQITVQVLPTRDVWFGMTYKEDKPTVMKAFEELYQKGVYQDVLFSDLENEKV